MTPKEIYCMGRAEYLAEYEGYSLTEGYVKAEKEWEEKNNQNHILSGGKCMKKTNEIILAFIGEPTSKDSPCTSTGHGYDAFICTESHEVYNLFKSLCMWGGATKTYKKGEDYYSYFELDCRHKEFFKSEIFQRICKPYNVSITVYEDGKDLYENFYSMAKYPY